MNNHPDLYSMMHQIHDAIQRDLHRHIMMERSSSGLSPTIEIVEPDIPFLYSEGPIMEDDADIRQGTRLREFTNKVRLTVI